MAWGPTPMPDAFAPPRSAYPVLPPSLSAWGPTPTPDAFAPPRSAYPVLPPSLSPWAPPPTPDAFACSSGPLLSFGGPVTSHQPPDVRQGPAQPITAPPV